MIYLLCGVLIGGAVGVWWRVIVVAPRRHRARMEDEARRFDDLMSETLGRTRGDA